jgi:hypothetical protein
MKRHNPNVQKVAAQLVEFNQEIRRDHPLVKKGRQGQVMGVCVSTLRQVRDVLHP